MNSTFNNMEFRQALGSFTTGVTIVTTRGADQSDVGLTANSFNSVSIEPPMILWSLGKAALSMPQFQSADYFAVHILSEEQQNLSARFATRGIDKFADLSLQRGPANIPLLQECAALFICKTAFQYEGGDHIIFVGEVVDFYHSLQQPLLFYRGQYSQLAKINTAEAPQPGCDFQDTTLGFLLRYCSHRLLGQLKIKLAEFDLSITQYYFLALILKAPARKYRDDLIRYAKQGDNAPTDCDIDELITKGLIESRDECLSLTQAGTDLHLKLVTHYKAAESTALNSLDYEERQMLQITLEKLAAAFPTDF